MVDNKERFDQRQFDQKYPKTEEEIELKHKKFQGSLVIEGYPELEEIYLYDVRNIDEVILKNLPKLEACTISVCGMKNLIIEDCLQIKNLDVQNNFLTALDFSQNLEKLEKLTIEGNPSLIEVLKPYEGDWKACRRDFQELIELSKQKPVLRQILGLREQNKKLRKELEEYKSSPRLLMNNQINFKEKYQELKRFLSFLSSEEQKKTEEIKAEKTDELKKNLERKLFDLKKLNKQLEEKFAPFEQVYQKIEKKEKDLEELKSAIITKNHLEEDDLEDILEAQEDFLKNNNPKRLERTKRKLIKRTSEKEVNELCQKQGEVVQLKLEFNYWERKIVQVTNNFSGNFSNFTGGVGNNGEVTGEQIVSVFSQLEARQQFVQKLPKYSK
jgi:hypothetical protein